jgi:hypothetical protein
LAVLGDDNPNWRPAGYFQETFGCKMDFQFPMVKLLDHLSDLDALERSDNPFATIVLTHLMTMKTASEPENRRLWKVRLIRLLYQRGYDALEIRRLFRVIDWMMDLPTNLELQFKNDLETIEMENSMPYVTSIERLAKAEGQEKGSFVGAIRTYESLLGIASSDDSDLFEKSVEQLAKMANDLKVTVRSRFGIG